MPVSADGEGRRPRIAILYCCVNLLGPLGLSAVSAAALAEPLALPQVDWAFPNGARLNVPTDGELEKQGARIGQVTVIVGDVFEDVLQLTAPYRLLDHLHIETREATVRNQLLFEPGDAYRGRVLEETARQLRAQRYLNEASVAPVRYNEDNTVDVEVRVHDVWTISPGISFGRKGGANSTRFEFEDTNFLGLGKKVEASRGSDADRTSWELAYRDPNVLGSRWTLAASRADLSDGGETTLAVGLPFYSFDSPFCIGFGGVDSQKTVSRYALGEIADQFGMDRSAFEVHGGVSQGWRDGWVRRYLFGVHHETRRFAPVAGALAAAQLPEDRTLSYPWIGLELIEDRYRRLRNLNQIGRIEDLYLGRSLRVELGVSSPVFGADRSALMLAGSAGMGFELAEDSYLTGALDFTGRVEQGGLRNSLLTLDTRYYHRQSPRRVFFAGLTTSIDEHPDPEEQLLLGGDNGLRGYPLRYQAGTARALMTLEERFYTNWQPLKLFDVGAAIFFDAGRTWGSDPTGGSLGWLKDVGVGLRLGSARGGRGNVVHIDLAYPLDRPSGGGIDGVQLIVETRASF